MVTTSELANCLEGHVMLYEAAPVPWEAGKVREIGELRRGSTATVLAVMTANHPSVYIISPHGMGWVLSAYVRRVAKGE